MPRRKAKLRTIDSIPSTPTPLPKTAWEALNEPVVEISPATGEKIVMMALAFLMFAMISPYWGSADRGQYTKHSRLDSSLPRIAGLQTLSTPEWYYTLQAAPGAIVDAFAQAANEVLDISEPIQQIADFYEPGFQAVGDAWLELMADPY